MYYDVFTMARTCCKVHDWPAVFIYLCFASGGAFLVKEKLGHKIPRHSMIVQNARNFHHGSGVVSWLWLLVFYRNCHHTYVICMHGS